MKCFALYKLIRAIHEDEDGIEAIQVVMVVAIAAVVLLAVMVLGQDIYDWLINSWLDLSDKTIE